MAVSQDEIMAKSDLKPVPGSLGAWAFLRTGRLPKGDKRGRAHLKALREVLHREAGHLTATKALLIEQAVRSEGILILVERFIWEQGFVKRDKLAAGIIEVQSCLRDLFFTAINSQRLALVSLAALMKRDGEEFIDVLALTREGEVRPRPGRSKGLARRLREAEAARRGQRAEKSRS